MHLYIRVCGREVVRGWAQARVPEGELAVARRRARVRDLDTLGYVFTNVHSAFKFEIKHMATSVATTDSISHLFEKKR